LLSGSPAIDAGDNDVCAASPVNDYDEIRTIRPIDGDGQNGAVCDIGAIEVLGGQMSPLVQPARVNTPGSIAAPMSSPAPKVGGSGGQTVQITRLPNVINPNDVVGTNTPVSGPRTPIPTWTPAKIPTGGPSLEPTTGGFCGDGGCS